MKTQNRNVKRLTTLLTVLSLVLALGAGASALTGAAAAEADSSYSLNDMLTYALQDEYNARTEYAAIQAEFGTQRLYSNIQRAEETHIKALLPLFETYDVSLPAEPSVDSIDLPATLAETYAVGVTAEVNNIAMYDKFLAQNDLPDDVRLVFTNLKRASENHLKAFQRAVDGDIGTGVGQANGRRGTANQNNNAGTGICTGTGTCLVDGSTVTRSQATAGRFGQQAGGRGRR